MIAALRLMKAEVGSLLLIDEEKHQLYFEIGLGEKEEALKAVTLNIGQGIAGWVAQHGEPLIVNSPESDPRFLKEVGDKIGYHTRNIICVPVKAKGRVIGVLEAINRQGKTGFRQEDLSILTSLADLVAIALDNARLYAELEEMFFQTAESLSDAIEKRDPYTGGHTKRVAIYTAAIARYLPLTPEERKRLKIIAILHDVGKIGIEGKLLRKKEPLTAEEFEAIKRHSTMGAEIINPIKPLKNDIIPGVKYHHERIDGQGYPEGLRAEEMPRLAKIVAVADTYDAMTTDRPYRKAMGKDEAIQELKNSSGTQLDGEVVDAFVRAFENGEI